ncbi:MAG: protein translocase subunit SecF [Desulfomonilaceae bacterium]|nr:protein translocase subunit SecF [Desulfomonilaceae bacterium]
MEIIPPNTKIDFLGNRRYAYIFSALLIVVSIASMPIMGKVQLGIDFTGGVMVQVMFKKQVAVEDIRDTLSPFSRSLVIQKLSGEADGEEYILRMEEPGEDSENFAQRVEQALVEKFGKDEVEIRGLEMVGPKVGHDLRRAAIWATIVALAFLLIYMAFRFTFVMGLASIVCVVHDLIIIYGFFVWTGKEFNLTILAALLTVVGYDINDTIVLCDRIRENLKSMRKKPLVEVLNASINQTLSRTVLTSGFTLLVVVALLVFGTTVLRDFGLALMIGMIFGTYSSIFVAAPLVLVLDKILPVRR